jgi:hypothetical protein
MMREAMDRLDVGYFGLATLLNFQALPSAPAEEIE